VNSCAVAMRGCIRRCCEWEVPMLGYLVQNF